MELLDSLIDCFSDIFRVINSHLIFLLSLFPITLSEAHSGCLIIPRQGFEGFISYPSFQFFFMGEADDSIPTFDFMIQKIQWFTWIMSFQPKGYLTEFHSKRVLI
ncbi:MAG: hypothetical protein WD426_00085, partial [Anditalea sp.]